MSSRPCVTSGENMFESLVVFTINNERQQGICKPIRHSWGQAELSKVLMEVDIYLKMDPSSYTKATHKPALACSCGLCGEPRLASGVPLRTRAVHPSPFRPHREVTVRSEVRWTLRVPPWKSPSSGDNMLLSHERVVSVFCV